MKKPFPISISAISIIAVFVLVAILRLFLEEPVSGGYSKASPDGKYVASASNIFTKNSPTQYHIVSPSKLQIQKNSKSNGLKLKNRWLILDLTTIGGSFSGLLIHLMLVISMKDSYYTLNTSLKLPLQNKTLHPTSDRVYAS